MGCIILSAEKVSSKKIIMVFAEGTILKPGSLIGHFNLSTYIPIGNSRKILEEWQEQGAEIIYCTSLKKNKVDIMVSLLADYKFPGTKIYYRDKGQTYKDIIELVKPDILVEDNCKSIGGSRQMCITYVNNDLKSKIKSVVVEEFKGIDHLPKDFRQIF